MSTGVISIEERTAASEAELSPLTQQNINDGSSTTYEMEIALVNLAAGTLVRSMGAAARPVRVVTAVPTASSPDGIYLVVGA